MRERERGEEEEDTGRKAAGYSHGFIIGYKALSCECVCVCVQHTECVRTEASFYLCS